MKIVFICTGNTCRSPLAESYARTKFEGGEFESRGLMVFSGKTSSETIDIIERESLVPPSLPSQLRPEDVKDSLLLTMTEEHKMMVIQRYPGADVRMISEFAEGTKKPISDPYGRSVKEYELVYNQLKSYIDKFNL
ncbi:low molecular weight phosphatase family protein [Salinicoccus carnicancri]|uniref:arsenate reductase/protein-tyrosine-phosphatase family protein n=1 Tax=Salinicoccus carnicancri TaxID=558170 RepID=UPI00031717ED|nr:low molecular weight phosphatase family protein [Salinicoccus carnicancri]